MSSNAAHISNSPPATPIAPRSRRASITEMFSRPSNGGPPPLNTNASNAAPLFTAAAAASNAQQQPHRRRMSITTLGLSGSPTNQSAPFGQAVAGATPTTAPAAPPSGRRRRGSMSSSILSSSPTMEQAVVEEEDEEGDDTPLPTSASPFARRVSFSFRDRAASINGIYQSLSIPVPSFKYHTTSIHHGRGGSLVNALFVIFTPHILILENVNADNTSVQTGEGFNWPEALRTRAERAPSLAGSFSMHQQQQGQGQGHGHGQAHQQPLSAGSSTTSTSPSSSPSLSSSFSSGSFSGKHHRSASVATMEAYKPPPKELLERHPSSPPPPTQQQRSQQQQAKPRPKPDYFQEKILRADFMD
ncbi:uncharacterized protein GIQ15_04504 [Arthroderma uncinatum]|uniref:uncharacterized protein n=1 Tax=Arthroderma uncinatum TaxID=74035 RepID=UPI00144A9193|nr:uncharacterized protein GIQ15_04504 [Arthroderma uncinatum]KAF3481745.1 hypothetical protein GIQ15_04504 [Arthroderma uncinatum]